MKIQRSRVIAVISGAVCFLAALACVFSPESLNAACNSVAATNFEIRIVSAECDNALVPVGAAPINFSGTWEYSTGTDTDGNPLTGGGSLDWTLGNPFSSTATSGAYTNGGYYNPPDSANCNVTSDVPFKVVEIAGVNQDAAVICFQKEVTLTGVPEPGPDFPANCAVWAALSGPVSLPASTGKFVTFTPTGASATSDDLIKVKGTCGTSSAINAGILSVQVEGISFTAGGQNVDVLGSGQTVYATVLTHKPAGRTLIWSVESVVPANPGDPLPVIIPVNGPGDGYSLTLGSGSGSAVIKAVDSGTGCGWMRTIKIGCACACSSGTCNSLGQMGTQVNSVDVKFSLGFAPGGSSMGDIWIKSDAASLSLSQPNAVAPSEGPFHVHDSSSASTSADHPPGFKTETMEYLVGAEGMPRQILVPDGLVDIVVNNQFKYDLVFYSTNTVGAKNGSGYYTFTDAPKVRYTIENPDASTNVYNRLRITKSTGGESVVTEYVNHDSRGTNEWTMSTGNGLRVEKVARYRDGACSSTLRTVSDSSGKQVSRELSVFADFGWGPAVVRKVIDPDGAALTTTWSYYADQVETGKYMKIAMVVNPDGGWTKYDYNANGQTISEMSGFKDSGTNSIPSAARATYYNYTRHGDEGGELANFNPRTVTETVLGVTKSITYYSYPVNSSGERMEITEIACGPNAAYANAGNLRTIRTYYAENSAVGAGRIKSVEQSDGRIDAYIYENGLYTTNTNPGLCSFATGTNDYFRTTVTHVTKENPDGVAGKTTRDVSVIDRMGGNVLTESYIYTDSGYERIKWTVQYLDASHKPLAVFHSDGTQSETSWGCCGKEWEKDAGGIEKTYSYDALNRMDISTRQGDAPIISASVFDAAGRALTNTISSDGLVLNTSIVYDLAGRVSSNVDQGGVMTTYHYNGLTNTTIRGGLTNVTVNYLDGTTKYTMENGTIKSWNDSGVNADGTSWAITYSGPAGTNSPVWQKTTTDFLGRTIKTERPGFGGAILASTSTYNSKGQLTSTTQQPNNSTTLSEYNELGQQFRSGLDVNTNGVLDLAGPDRVNESATWYQEDSHQNYWQYRASIIYAGENSGVPVTNSIQATQLTGLGTPARTYFVPNPDDDEILVSRQTSTDLLGNTTESRTFVSRLHKTTRQTVDYPDSVTTAEQISQNGLLISSVSKTGVLTTNTYDALGRQLSAFSPGGEGARLVGSYTTYNSLGQVASTMDAASNVTTDVYDNLGRRIQVTDALSNSTYTAYSPEGQVLATWGATYPVAYDYDDSGRMTAMYTYRGTNTVSSYSEINTLKSQMDRTRWLYDEATGLLTNKQYSDNHGPSYSYTPDGKLATRTWARGVVTSYEHDLLGQLTNISYSDGTPSVTFAFDRLGRQTTITDGAGTRLFSYTDAFQLASETNAAAELVRIYDSQGRPAGCDLVMAGSTSAVSTIRYSHDEVGRFHQVDADLRAASLPLQNFRYGYLADSDLIESLNETNIGYGVSRSFEPNRNLITQMLNTSGTNRISRFDYVNDAVGRRTQRIDSTFLTNDFSYNTRSELIEALMGANNFSYRYDSIGNRTVATNNGVVTEYLANSLNQYSQITNNLQPITPSFDLDGNMTSYGQWAFAWDAENRLTGASSTSTVANYSYDYMSRRHRKVVNGVTNNFVYDGWNLISEISSGGSESITNSYVWGIDLSGTQQGAGGIGGLLSVTRNGVTYFPCYDANGNIADYVDASGAVVAHREYDAYGNTVASSGSMVNDFSFWFSSKYLDQETGLYYYGFRYYLTEAGRWASRDPIGEAGFVNAATVIIGMSGVVRSWTIDASDQSVQAGMLEPAYSFSRNAPIDRFDVFGLACGSGWTEWVVPDSPGGFPFETPCQNHDDCYGDKGCQAGKTKADCDKGLRDDALRVCSKQPEKVLSKCFIRDRMGGRWEPCWLYPRQQCEKYADIYYKAVKKYGQTPFDNARKNCCVTVPDSWDRGVRP